MADLPTHHREDFSWPPTRTLTWPRTGLGVDAVRPIRDEIRWRVETLIGSLQLETAPAVRRSATCR